MIKPALSSITDYDIFCLTYLPHGSSFSQCLHIISSAPQLGSNTARKLIFPK